MAQGGLYKTSMCIKFLPCIVLFVSVGFITGEEFYIVPSQDHPCCADHCLTLSQFIDDFTNCSECDNTTLIFAAGNYNLESDLLVEDIYSFSMYALFPSRIQINCNLDTKFIFRNVSIVTVDRLNFLDCSCNLFEFVSQFYLTDSTFYGHPEAESTTLTIADSTAYLDRIAFLSTVESAPDHIYKLHPQENCSLNSTIFKIWANNSVVVISQGLFDSSIWGLGAVIYGCGSSEITIFNSIFKNNSASCCSSTFCDGAVLRMNRSILDVRDCRFEYNQGVISTTIKGDANFTHSTFSHHYDIYNVDATVILIEYSNLSISYSTFINNTIAAVAGYHSNVVIDHSVFVNTSAGYLISLFPEMVTITLNEFISNRIGLALVRIKHFTESGTIVGNIFIDNSAPYDILIDAVCEPGFSLSLGSSRCIECPEHWYRNLVGLLVTAIVAGALLVIFMLALNLTVAVGTLNGILFYANIVASNTDAYFPLSSAPNVASVLVSWLNLEFGFDICVYEGMTVESKALLQLAFPAYVILLVVIVIIVSEYSSKFARIIGKGDPVAVLATMILVSYTNLFKAVIGSVSLLYGLPAYGSLNFNPTYFISYKKDFGLHYTDISFVLMVVSSPILLVGLLYMALVFFWKWLVWYQDKAIFKWVRYQKLQHFMEPYHAPYTGKYRYWTGLLLIMRIILFSVSAINFSRDPRVDFVSTIFVIGGLMLFKGVTAKRIYKNVILDVMETAIYFNLVFFAAFSWYCFDFGGNQVAVAYISVMIVFILVLTVIVFHLLRFTCFYKLSFVQQSIKWITSKLTGKKPARENLNEDQPNEVDALLLHGVRPPHVSYSVVGMSNNETNAA